MRQIALLALLLAFAAAVYGQENILEKGLEGRSAADVISRRYVTPLRLVALPVEIPEQRFGIFHPRRQLAGQCDQPQRGHVPA